MPFEIPAQTRAQHGLARGYFFTRQLTPAR